ncbi:class I SAM-dependent DNA methyltransferase [[Mycobacterium] zoologicum]|uniref:class I SAM-dependent DNA methyltransferase n=1 Tax=[Mycobacterium] zoologicum TaxID=2872311 RepID=UPI002B866287|nr:DNA methyltransferase [Mycolicibacter sp. MYC101]MEB3065039.1 DNA methyltransferase [Mycolicibacter sp. MYC101]
MTDTPLSLVEEHLYQELFLHELNWSAPDSTPISYTADDGQTYTATNVSSYKGLRVWVCDEKPGSKIEAELDRLIAKSTTDRLVIFHNDQEQVWRWPARRIKDNSTSTRLTRHQHRNGRANPNFAARLDVIRLPNDTVLDANTVLTKVREAFDVEARNESKRASKLMARMYSALEAAYPASYDATKRDHEISTILARILFLMFGDDTEMWEDQHGVPVADAFLEFMHLQTPADASTLGEQLTDLFDALDKPGGAAANGINAALPYINGGLFREKITLPPLSRDFRNAVLDACAVNWSTISPAIFGSMFQSVRDARTRRELGEHYTSEDSILKTLNPLFLDELRAEFDRARTMKDEKGVLTRLWKRLGEIRYIDPACGCGNFIIVAFRELRDLELRIMERLQELAGASQLAFDPTLALKVTLDHFYGIEIDEWPARIAETAMFLVDRQCDLKLKERFGEAPQRLPIQTQANITVGNAIRMPWQEICPASESVVLAGNPPYGGRGERSAEQTGDLRGVWGDDYKINLDYVTAWFVKTLEYFGELTGKWAFVATSSISQGEPVARLWRRILNSDWRCRFAHKSMLWDSEAPGRAGVHVSIVGFDRATTPAPILWTYPDGGRGEPEMHTAANINPYLFDGPTVFVDARRTPLCTQLPAASFGSMPNDGGNLLVEPDEYDAVASDPIAAKYLRRFIGAGELIHNRKRWCLWLRDATREDLSASPVLADRIAAVRAHRRGSDSPTTSTRNHPSHLFGQIAQPSTSYLAVPAHVSERRRFYPAARFDTDVICGNANFLIPDPEGFALAVISSSMFIIWQKAIGGRIRNDLRFSKTFTYYTFPLPPLSDRQCAAACEAAQHLLTVRAAHRGASLADLYEEDAIPGDLIEAHLAVDAVIDQAYAPAQLHTEKERQDALFSQYVALTDTTARNGRQRRCQR